MSTASTAAFEWITAASACRILGNGPDTLKRLVSSGRLSRLEVPGSKPKYRKDEVEALAQSSLRMATTAQAS